MLALAGMLLVFAAVFGGYLMERGNPWVLLQPAELVIIGGSALGIVLVANPLPVIRKMVRGIAALLHAHGPDRPSFLRYLRMLYELFAYSQRARGMAAIESDVEDPWNSPIFSNYPEFLANAPVRDFVCDTLRMLVIGASEPQELDLLMDLDIDVQRRGSHEPVRALSSVADSLPGLGIVAAVLGVVITMQSIGGAPETIGQKVAAALVGTFLGILLCYGVVGPLASRLESLGDSQAQFLQVLRIAIITFTRGAGATLAVEYARRSIPLELRPTFLDLETTIRRDAHVPAVPLANQPGTPGQESHDAASVGAN